MQNIQAADGKESRLPGLPQSKRRDAGASSCAAQCRTVLRRRKEHHRKNAVPIDDDNLGFFHCGRVLGCFFVIEVFGTNAQPASARCRSNGVWAQPNKHFEFGFEKSDSKIASWYQLALLASFVWALSLREVSTLKVRSC